LVLLRSVLYEVGEPRTGMVQASTVYPDDRCALGESRLRYGVVTGAHGTIDWVMPLALPGMPLLPAVELFPMVGSMSSPRERSAGWESGLLCQGSW
jgi:hypothetical protein